MRASGCIPEASELRSFVLLHSSFCIPASGWCRRIMPHEQRNVRLRMAVQQDIDRVESWIVELQLLDVHDEVARAEMHVIGQRHFHRDGWELRYGAAIRVHEVERQGVLALVSARKGDAQRNRALRVDRGELLRVNGVERPQQVQLAIVIGRSVAQNGYLNIHPAPIKPRMARLRTN